MQPLILVIDDSMTMRKILETALSREGFEVLSFADGVEVLRWLRTSPDARVPALVILDLVLPKMNGYQVAQCLKAQPGWRETSIIMLSRRHGPLDRLKSRLAGAAAHLSKPLQVPRLLAVVHAFVGVPV
jgi:twitching motility two-component system response regulator PilG